MAARIAGAYRRAAWSRHCAMRIERQRVSAYPPAVSITMHYQPRRPRVAKCRGGVSRGVRELASAPRRPRLVARCGMACLARGWIRCAVCIDRRTREVRGRVPQHCGRRCSRRYTCASTNTSRTHISTITSIAGCCCCGARAGAGTAAWDSLMSFLFQLAAQTKLSPSFFFPAEAATTPRHTWQPASWCIKVRKQMLIQRNPKPGNTFSNVFNGLCVAVRGGSEHHPARKLRIHGPRGPVGPLPKMARGPISGAALGLRWVENSLRGCARRRRRGDLIPGRMAGTPQGGIAC